MTVGDHYPNFNCTLDGIGGTQGNNSSNINGISTIDGQRFPCSVCGKSYLRKRHLQRHMRDECIGIPPRFKCDLCPSRFRRKYHMVRHMNSKHGIPPPPHMNMTQDDMKPENLSIKKENYENNDMNNSNNIGGCGVTNNLSAAAAMDSVVQASVLAAAMNAAAAAAANGGENGHDERDSKDNFTDLKAVINDEDWKMKLSLQLISNSLLKERLVNAMPFAYNNN